VVDTRLHAVQEFGYLLTVEGSKPNAISSWLPGCVIGRVPSFAGRYLLAFLVLRVLS
jgi:hypothetical protein